MLTCFYFAVPLKGYLKVLIQEKHQKKKSNFFISAVQPTIRDLTSTENFSSWMHSSSINVNKLPHNSLTFAKHFARTVHLVKQNLSSLTTSAASSANSTLFSTSLKCFSLSGENLTKTYISPTVSNEYHRTLDFFVVWLSYWVGVTMGF